MSSRSRSPVTMLLIGGVAINPIRSGELDLRNGYEFSVADLVPAGAVSLAKVVVLAESGR